MHPALPSGVHQKALETYDIIFKCMGTNRLAAELFIYSAGLFPLLANAAMNVRSALLTGRQDWDKKVADKEYEVSLYIQRFLLSPLIRCFPNDLIQPV